MRKPFTLRRPSPAMAVALTALFVALGGTSYALASLPANSVGTAQLKSNAVTTSKIKNGAVTASKLNLTGVTGEAWHLVGAAGQPAFQNGWSNYGLGFAHAGFYRDPIGRVHLQGIVTGGSANSTVFTLPAGYRPRHAHAFAVAAGSGAPALENVDVYTNGAVFAFGSANPVVLDGVSFRPS